MCSGSMRAPSSRRSRDATPACARRYLSATCAFDPDPDLQQRWSSPGTVWISQGFIAQRRDRRHRAARSRRFRHFGQLLRGEAAGAPAGDLDRRAGHVQREPALGADGAAAARARVRRGAGNRQQRREGAASPLHHAREAVRHSAVRLRDADAEARRHRHHHARRQRRGAGEGGHDQEEHHADLDGNRRDVALGRLSRRCVRGVQAARLVHRPRVHLGDQRHRVARSGCERTRQVDARCADRRTSAGCAASK